MNKKLIVFDMDDVLWDLNRKATRMAGVDYAKLTVFSLYENQNLTDGEKARMTALYTGTELFKDIVFHDRIISLVNDIHHNHPDCEVRIVSNCTSQEVKNLKTKQLLRVIDLPEDRIHMHVIDMATESCRKKLPEHMFLFVDDSPHNIRMADAVYRIMPAKPYNHDCMQEPDGFLYRSDVIRTYDDDQLVLAVKNILEGKNHDILF